MHRGEITLTPNLHAASPTTHITMRALVWRHLALLSALGVVFVFLADLLTGAPKRAGGWSGAPLAALATIPDALYMLIGPIAAIAVGTLRPDRREVGEAVRITVLATLVMLALGLLTPSSSGGAMRSAMRAALTLDADARHQVSVVLSEYPSQHPRLIARESVMRAGMLLLPTVLIGMVLGVGAWLHSRVVFRFPRDGVIARWAVALVLVPVAAGAIVNWSASFGYEILFQGRSLLLTLVPYVPALLVGAVGWSAARRHQNDGQNDAQNDGPRDAPNDMQTIDTLHRPA